MGTISEKLEYLNTTKSKIKDSINLTGVNITDETFREYASELQDGLLYILDNGVDVIWENWNKVTGSGTSLTLNNTLEAKMKIKLKGNTYQDSTTGKNLYNDNFDDYTQPVNYRICPITLTQGQTYVLKGNKIGTTITGTVVAVVPYGEQYTDFSTQIKIAVDSGGNGHTLTFTPDSTWTSPKLAIYASDKTTFDNLFTNYEIQLEKGSAATSYEPYTNGASPNPDYPQDIHVVSGDNSVKIDNNVFNENNATIIDAYLATSELGKLYKDSYSVNKVLIFEGEFNKTYVIQKTLSSRFRVATYSSIVSNTTQLNNGIYNDNGTSITISTTSTDKYIYVGYWTNTDTLTAQQILDSIKISIGEPYQSQTYPINLPAGMELCKIGTYQDKIDKSTGKNLFDYSNIVNLAMSNTIETASNYKGYYIPYTSGETYTISRNTTSNTKNNRFRIAFTYEEPANGVKLYDSEGTQVGLNGAINGDSLLSMSISSNLDFKYIFIYLSNNATTLTTDDVLFMLNEGSTALPYEPYGTSWYLKKEIGKKTLTTSDFYNILSSYSNLDYVAIYKPDDSINKGNSNDIPIIYTKGTYSKITNFNNLDNLNKITASGGYNHYYLGVTKGITTEEAQNIVNGSVLNYILTTPTYTKITDSTLLSQLEAIKKSYEGQTNISQTNDDLPFILDTIALSQLS